ncbi:MAG: carotenoid biosynthesis protein [Bacteroidales bacterium]|nr:carotenoid biosynthesis protein [Bacteroidales bacterium]
MNNFFRCIKHKSKARIVILLCLAFFVFTIGFLGLIYPGTHSRSLQFTPYAIMLSLVVVLFYAEQPYSLKTILIFLTIAAAGYFIEVIGVNTQKIFGSYRYGKTLGFSLFNTPLLIGINWLLLVYTSASLFEKMVIPDGLKILFASLVMLLYDIIIEPVAAKIDMWHWVNSIIPLQNYIAWFVTAVILHAVLKWSGTETKNPAAPWVLLCQFVFFLALRLCLK